MASRAVPLSAEETQTLNDCLLVSASTETEQTVEEQVVACLEEQLGSEVARTLVAGDRQETAEEQTVLEACLLVTASGITQED